MGGFRKIVNRVEPNFLSVSVSNCGHGPRSSSFACSTTRRPPGATRPDAANRSSAPSSNPARYGGSMNTRSKTRSVFSSRASALSTSRMRTSNRPATPQCSALRRRIRATPESASTATTLRAPRESASSPRMPLPAKRSRTQESVIASRCSSMPNADSRKRALLGRTWSPRGTSIRLPFDSPAIRRIARCPTATRTAFCRSATNTQDKANPQ
jgi:hypothetical protein